jgi:undecaprenyl-diphosphatase
MTVHSTPATGLRSRELLQVAAVGAGALLFGVLLLLVRLQWVPLESIDHGLAAALNRAVAAHRPLVVALGFVTRLGSHAVLIWLIVIAAVLLLIRRRYRLVAFLVVSGAGALILDPALKAAVGRLRPVVAHPVAIGGGNSFPSGHSLGSIIVYGALLMVFAPALPRRWRTPVIVFAGVLVAAIGFTRLALGVHYLSDVLGAWALGIAWLGITAYATELWRVEEGLRPTQPFTEGLEPEAARDLKPTRPMPHAAVLRTRWAIAGGLVAWVLVFGALYALGTPLAHYHKGNGNILGDTTVPHWLAAHRTPLLDKVSFLGSEAGNTHAILAVGLIAGAVALGVIRQWRPVVFLLATMFGELTLFLASAAIVDRARPEVPQLDGRLPTSSYPSGHVAATICLYTAIAVLFMPRTRAWWRWLLVVAAVLMPLWVAVSRLYRGMHHPTDLLGAVLLAAAWLVAMVYLVRPNCDLSRAGPRRGADRPRVASGRE